MSSEQQTVQGSGRSSLLVRLIKVSALVLAVLIVVLGVVAWLLRDLPRRRVESSLAERLGAVVHIGRLELVGSEMVRLHGVRLDLEAPADSARLGRLEIATLEARGTIGEMVAGRFDTMLIEGLAGRVDLCSGAAWRPPPQDGPDSARIGRLVVRGSYVLVGCGEKWVRLTTEATLEDVGAAAHGTLELAAGRLELELPALPASLVASGPRSPVRLSVEQGAAHARIERTGEDGLTAVELTARAANVRLVGGSGGAVEVELGAPELGARLEQLASGQWHLEVAPRPGQVALVGACGIAEGSRLEAVLGTSPPRLEQVDLVIKALRLEPLLALVGITIGGRPGPLDLEVHGRPEDGLELRARLERVAVSTPLGEVTGRLVVDGSVEARDRQRGVTARAQLDLDGLAAPGRPTPRAGRVALTDRVARLALPLRLAVTARIEAGQVLVERAELPSARLGVLEAAGRIGLSGAHELDLSWSCRGTELGPLVEALALDGPVTPVVTGRIEASGTLGGTVAAPRLKARLRPGPVAVETALGGHSARVSVVSSRDASAPPIDLTLSIAPAPVLGVVVHALPLRLEAEELAEPIAAELEAAFRVGPEGHGAGSRGAGQTSGVRLPGGSRLVIEALRLDAGQLGQLEAANAADGGVGLALTGSRIGSWMRVSGLTGLHGQGALPPLLAEASVSGDLEADLTLTPSQARGWEIAGSVGLTSAGLTSADSSRVLEGLAGRLELSGEMMASDQARVQAEGRIGGFQLLWDTVYGDYSSREASVKLGLELEPGAWTSTLGLALESMLQLDVEAAGGLGTGLADETPRASGDGVAGAAAVRWKARVETGDLPGVWARYVQQPLAGSLAAVDALELGSGRMLAELEGELGCSPGSGCDGLPAPIRVRGRAQVEQVTASAGTGLSVTGLELDLPVALVLGKGGPIGAVEPRPGESGRPDQGPAGHGRLELASLDLAGVRLEALQTGVEVVGDSLTLEQSLRVPVLGGEVVLESLRLGRLLGPEPSLEAAVVLAGLRLENLTRALGLPKLEGRLDGRFPRLLLTRDRLRVDGVGELRLLGGRVEVHDIAGRDMLSAYPRLTLSASWEGIDLAQLTQTFDFGNISGVVEGRLDDCELFRGIPIRCSARVRSVRVPDVSQRISLKAVNNIAIVGTGAGLGFIDRGIHRFISSYSYNGIGIAMELADDRFLLRGLESRGETELFIKGRLPLRLDVVNVHPGTTVSFSAMLDRLRNLDLSDVRTAP